VKTVKEREEEQKRGKEEERKKEKKEEEERRKREREREVRCGSHRVRSAPPSPRLLINDEKREEE